MHPEAVELLVEAVEPLLEPVDPGGADLRRVDRDRDLVALPAVAHVGGVGHGARVVRDPLAVEPRIGAAAEVVEDLRDLVRRRVDEQADVRLRELVPEVRHEVADRAEQAGRRRDDHREGAHQLRDGVRVERPGAAVGDEGEVARVVTALHRDEAQRAGHVLVHDREDPFRRLLDRGEADRVGDRLDGGPRRVGVEAHLAAEELRRQVAEHDVRVGDGRLGAAPAVRGGPGLGARGLRADAERLRQLRAHARSSRRRRRRCARRPTGRGCGSAPIAVSRPIVGWPF